LSEIDEALGQKALDQDGFLRCRPRAEHSIELLFNMPGLGFSAIAFILQYDACATLEPVETPPVLLLKAFRIQRLIEISPQLKRPEADVGTFSYQSYLTYLLTHR